ncbi:MAG: cbb3-type cytochrome c oxidase subunit I [Candidatus Kariarchaeaceae archaeon]|jgi:cytochrome c oxidase subunit 1
MAELNKEEFRVCPETTFRVYKPAQMLMIVNAVVAVLCLTVGGITALLMGLHKSPDQVWSLLENSQQYYRVVHAHGFNMLIFWVVWFEIAAGYFVSTVILNSPMYSVKMGWLQVGMMLTGTLGLEYLMFFGEFKNIVMFTAYHPLTAQPAFYFFYIVYALGVLVGGLNFFMTVYHAKKNKTYPHESLPLVVYGVFVAFVIAVQALLNGAIVLIMAWLFSLGVIPEPVDADLWKQVFWGFGHTAQYINISATAAVWYTLIAISTGAKPLNEKFSRTAFLFYLIFTVPVATHHLIVDPAYSMPFKIINATILALGLAVPSMIHAFVIPGALEKQIREQHKDDETVTDTTLGWMRKMPWNEPAIPAIIWSVFLFGIGGIMGSIQGTYQLNMITHNTLRINAHFHLTVVAGTTVAFMGLAYYFIELIPRRKIFFGKLKAIQIHLYAIGLLLLSLGMFIAGVLGAPRRTATYQNYATAGFELPAWDFGLYLLSFGAIVAVLGGGLFVFLIVTSLFFGEKLPEEGDWSTPTPGAELESEETEHSEGLEAPGTFGLGVLFMILFALFYLVTFIILSQGWDVGRITYP